MVVFKVMCHNLMSLFNYIILTLISNFHWQEFFPKHIQVVFLLQPKGFFQRAFADMKSKFVKEELEFKVSERGTRVQGQLN